MKNRRLDENWDYCFGHGINDYLTGVEAVAQAIKSRLLLLYREWWEDLEDGLPLFEKILASSGREDNIAAVDIIIKDRIANTKDVLAVLSFSSDFDRNSRVYQFSANVDTVYGTLFVTNKEG